MFGGSTPFRHFKTVVLNFVVDHLFAGVDRLLHAMDLPRLYQVLARKNIVNSGGGQNRVTQYDDDIVLGGVKEPLLGEGINLRDGHRLSIYR